MPGAPRTALSLFLDDTHSVPDFLLDPVLEFCAKLGVRGKVSVIPAFDSLVLSRTLGHTGSAPEEAFLAALRRAPALGFDLHLEGMTHDRLWDFRTGRMRGEGPCESIWLYEPGVTVGEYAGYLGAAVDHLRILGLGIHGLSVPGCDCDACAARWDELEAGGVANVSPNAIAALLDLASAGRLASPVATLYSDESDPAHPTRLLARSGRAAVYDARLDMSVADQIGFDGRLDADYYISADGRRGRIAELVLSGAEQCFFCAHWFSMNPGAEDGWRVFQTILTRIATHLSDRIEWVRPSDYGARLLARAGREDAHVSQG